ncbi:MAG TPA: replicative DNA helicase [Salinivirgaceae bacterium]|nr:replicative DNA helicase [Salinivirgaceae bacterium]
MAKKKTSMPVPEITLEAGRVLPHDRETEEFVIGALMLGQNDISEVIELLTPECFYTPECQKIYEAIQKLFNDGAPIDIITVADKLEKIGYLNEVGGRHYISSLTTKVGGTAYLQYHAKLVAEKHIRRELIRVSNQIQRHAFDETSDVVDLIDFSESEIFKVTEGNIKKNVIPFAQVLTEALKEIEENSKKPEGLTGVPSGFNALDRMTNGWQPSDLIIIAARPSMGKTAFVLSMARNMTVEYNRSVAFFSLEMSNKQLTTRLIASECEIESEKLRSGQLSEQEWLKIESGASRLKKVNLFIDDTAGIPITELRAKCRRLVADHKIDCVIIDYLQLITGTDSASREQEVAAISRSLKALAKELNIPIITLSQLNRSVENRSGSKRPQLSDLRESGSIEQDADIVLFIHRPSYYKLEVLSDGKTPSEGKAEIILAKHRNGAVGEVVLDFIANYARFANPISDGLPAAIGMPMDQPPIIQSKMNSEENFNLDLDIELVNDPYKNIFSDTGNLSDIPF